MWRCSLAGATLHKPQHSCICFMDRLSSPVVRHGTDNANNQSPRQPGKCRSPTLNLRSGCSRFSCWGAVSRLHKPTVGDSIINDFYVP